MGKLHLALPDKIQESLQANQSAIDDDSMKFPDVAQLNTIRQMTPAQLFDRLSRGTTPPFILDVREEEEYRDELGHIVSSQLIPLRHLPAKAAELADRKTSEIVVVCRAGVRSTTAAAILSALGFEPVSHLSGGMLEWNESKLPIER